jgi:hypothetical protein
MSFAGPTYEEEKETSFNGGKKTKSSNLVNVSFIST